MTRDEKVAQLGSAWVFQLARAGELERERAEPLLRNGIGHVTRISGASSLGAEQVRTSSRTPSSATSSRRRGSASRRSSTRRSAPGLMAREATVFPQAIGLASTWEPGARSRRSRDSIRMQMRAVGAHQGLAPVLDVCRDPRWGRTEETFGEDPYLVARMGVAFVRGLQGDDPRDGVIATAKHFVGYGASEGGMNWAPARIPPRELRDVYLHPFEAAVRDGRASRSVMNAYNEIDGVPCAADHELLTTLLREEWGFDGCVVSDYFSIRQLAELPPPRRSTRPDAAARRSSAGLDVELPSTDCYGRRSSRPLDRGSSTRRRSTARSRRVLRAKFELGLFEQPYVDADRGRTTTSGHARAPRARAHDRAQEPRPAEERRHPAARRPASARWR